MYCLHWMLPVLLVPKSACALVLQDQMVVILLYLLAFFLERRPCILCVLVFIIAVVVLCYSGIGQCIFCNWGPSHFTRSTCED
ncbi:Bladder cancer-associated protein [Geodia barretti]|uniref:Bladder cancer-associated protein n=1 Tax=Geodia barretti TaxID=519541 RepID=A0AA35S1F5_GEOBA|nr:Bladder cancer-associated protein [Geodia barretti]